MSIKLRKVRKEDCDDIFLWRNDEQTRKASFTPEPVLYEKHLEWFEKARRDPDIYIYIGENELDNKIGIIRINKINALVAEININIAPEMRGKGYGLDLIKLASQNFMAEVGNLLLIARIKKDNGASIASFGKAGFCEMFEYKDQNTGPVIVMIKGDNRG